MRLDEFDGSDAGKQRAKQLKDQAQAASERSAQLRKQAKQASAASSQRLIKAAKPKSTTIKPAGPVA